MKPSLGRIVLVRVDPTANNGSDVAPAVITRVFSDTIINVRVLVDAATTPLWKTSVTLQEAEPAAGAAHVAWWPPRV